MAGRDSGAHLTAKGLLRLERELKSIERRELPEAIERARAMREMSADPIEGGEYLQAMEEIVRLRSRVAEVKALIGSGEVVKRTSGDGVGLGSVVTLAERRREETFTVVGTAEADALHGRVSEDSPLGRALIGHRAGDKIEWPSPQGVNHARILKVA